MCGGNHETYNQKSHRKKKRLFISQQLAYQMQIVISSYFLPLSLSLSYTSLSKQPFSFHQIVQMPLKSKPSSLYKIRIFCSTPRSQQIETQSQQFQSLKPALICHYKLLLSIIQTRWTYQKIAKKL